MRLIMKLFLGWKEEYKQYGKATVSSNMSNTSVSKTKYLK